MSDSARNETTIDGNAEGPVLSGAFSGPTQSTSVHLHGLQPENSTAREIINSMWQIVSSLEKRQQLDDQERLERQKETDHYRSILTAQIREIAVRVARVEYAVVFLVAALVLAGVLVFLVAMK
jgi:hypothetical protein